MGRRHRIERDCLALLVLAGVMAQNPARAAPSETPLNLDVFDAQTILLLQAEGVTLGERKREEGGGYFNEVTVRLAIEEVLKGHVRQAVHDPFVIHVRSRPLGAGDSTGLWSVVGLLEKKRWLAFCAGGSDDAAALLTEERCSPFNLPFSPFTPVETELSDTRAVLRFEALRASRDRVLQEAESHADGHGYRFVEYVWRRVKSDVLTAPTVLATLLRLIESPRTRREARQSYLTLVHGVIGDTYPRRLDLEAALIKTELRLLVTDDTRFMERDLAGTLLPGVIGYRFNGSLRPGMIGYDSNGRARQDARTVFSDNPGELASITQALQRNAAKPDFRATASDTRRLLDWLQGKLTAPPK